MQNLKNRTFWNDIFRIRSNCLSLWYILTSLWQKSLIKIFHSLHKMHRPSSNWLLPWFRVHEWTLSAAFLYLYLCFCNCICAHVLYCIILYCIVLYLCTCICIRINLPVFFSYPEWTFSFSCTSGVTSEQSCIMSIFYTDHFCPTKFTPRKSE